MAFSLMLLSSNLWIQVTFHHLQHPLAMSFTAQKYCEEPPPLVSLNLPHPSSV